MAKVGGGPSFVWGFLLTFSFFTAFAACVEAVQKWLHARASGAKRNMSRTNPDPWGRTFFLGLTDGRAGVPSIFGSMRWDYPKGNGYLPFWEVTHAEKKFLSRW
jgi:hypothetical protein